MTTESAAPVPAGDAVALCRTRPEASSQAAALAAAGPDYRVAVWHETPVLLLLDDDAQLVLAVDGPRLIQTPDEIGRLLLPDPPPVDGPVWWVDVRAYAGRPGAAEAAHRLATRLVADHGGWVWPTAVAR